MTPPGGPPPAGRPRSLARDADRERLIARLREHYARGELELDELDRRVGIVLAATYTDEAAAAVADLPQLAGPAAARPGSGKRRTRRGHAQAATPGAGWVPTDERFRDPTTRTVMRVWVDPADQSRHYIPEDDD
jgi:Domain of unknown function (DUF1707)